MVRSPETRKIAFDRLITVCSRNFIIELLEATDAAHELGHLVLHVGLTERSLYDAAAFKEIERQTFYFAGAFLLPAESFGAEVWSPSLPAFVSLKERWKTSVGAMIMRCSNLEVVGDEYKQRLFKHYSAKGWRKREPLDDELTRRT